MGIPKVVYQSWHTIDVHPQIQRKMYEMRTMNPDYEFHLFTDYDMTHFVTNNFDADIIDCYNRLNIIVAKVDFWRYLVLYKYGGIYLDMDSSILKPLDQLMNPDDDAIVSLEGNLEWYLQWALVFNKGHPILKRTIDSIVDNIKNNRYPNDIHAMTGPAVFTRAIRSIHKEKYGTSENLANNKSFEIDGHKYRSYGIDYEGGFCFKYPESQYLYINKAHWSQEQREKPLLRC